MKATLSATWQTAILAVMCVLNLANFGLIITDKIGVFFQTLPYATYIVLLAYAVNLAILGPLGSLYLGGRTKVTGWLPTVSVLVFSMLPAFVPLYILLGSLKRN